MDNPHSQLQNLSNPTSNTPLPTDANTLIVSASTSKQTASCAAVSRPTEDHLSYYPPELEVNPPTSPNAMSGFAAKPTTSASSSGRTLKPLSCTTCRARKVKCNKTDPCSACVKSKTACVYPERVKRRKNRNGGLREQNANLLQRLSRLEVLVGEIEKSSSDEKGAETNSHGVVQDQVPRRRVLDKLQ